MGGDASCYTVGPVVRVLGTELGGDAPCYSVGLVVRVLGTEVGGNAPSYSVVLGPWSVSLEQSWVVMHLTTV